MPQATRVTYHTLINQGSFQACSLQPPCTTRSLDECSIFTFYAVLFTFFFLDIQIPLCYKSLSSDAKLWVTCLILKNRTWGLKKKNFGNSERFLNKHRPKINWKPNAWWMQNWGGEQCSRILQHGLAAASALETEQVYFIPNWPSHAQGTLPEIPRLRFQTIKCYKLPC